MSTAAQKRGYYQIHKDEVNARRRAKCRELRESRPEPAPVILTVAQEYQKKWREDNPEKIEEYREKARLRTKSKRDPGRKSGFAEHREKERIPFNAHELMDAHDDKCVRMFNQIIAGERGFTM
jgi:hypothetical protein